MKKISKKWQKRMDWIDVVVGGFVAIFLGGTSILLLRTSDLMAIDDNTTGAILGLAAFFGMLHWMRFYTSIDRWWKDERR